MRVLKEVMYDERTGEEKKLTGWICPSCNMSISPQHDICPNCLVVNANEQHVKQGKQILNG